MHLDIKPCNFLIFSEGCVKIGDFGLCKRINNSNDTSDNFEGDSVYLAPEILSTKQSKDVTYKSDIFSLGLSILEVLCKIELPQAGVLWTQIRTECFSIPEDFLKHSNLKTIPHNMLALVTAMISYSPNNRPDINTILETFPELKSRYIKLSLERNYTRYFNPDTFLPGDRDFNFGYVKRSNSYKNDY